MPPTAGGLDMLAAVELTAYASTKEPLTFELFIDKYTSESKWEIMSILTKEATVAAIPQIVANHELMIAFSIPNLEILYARAGQRIHDRY